MRKINILIKILLCFILIGLFKCDIVCNAEECDPSDVEGKLVENIVERLAEEDIFNRDWSISTEDKYKTASWNDRIL